MPICLFVIFTQLIQVPLMLYKGMITIVYLSFFTYNHFCQNINALSLDAYRRLTFQLYGGAGEAWFGIFFKY